MEPGVVRMKGFPVLMYHRIASGDCPVEDGEERRYAVVLEEFLWQLDFVAASAQKCPTLSEAAGGFGNGELSGITLITFDDGNRSDLVHALPALAQRGFKATFFVTVGRLGSPDGLDADMVARLHDAGMEIGSHGLTHRFLTLVTDEEAKQELEVSRDVLSEITGARVKSFAPPGGRIDRRVATLARRCGYEIICTSRVGLNRRASDPNGLRRFPVVATTTRRSFSAMIERRTVPLLPLYLRSSVLHLARRIAGETFYRTTRSGILRGKK